MNVSSAIIASFVRMLMLLRAVAIVLVTSQASKQLE